MDRNFKYYPTCQTIGNQRYSENTWLLPLSLILLSSLRTSGLASTSPEGSYNQTRQRNSNGRLYGTLCLLNVRCLLRIPLVEQVTHTKPTCVRTQSPFPFVFAVSPTNSYNCFSQTVYSMYRAYYIRCPQEYRLYTCVILYLLRFN